MRDFLNAGDYFYSGKDKFSNIEYIKTIDTTIIGVNYNQVKIFKIEQEYFSYQPRKTFYAKHIGLIRSELFNGQVWNLIRYHVTQ